MKFLKYILPAVVLSAAMTSCDSGNIDPVIPPVQAPVDTTQASMTILEFKQKFWTTEENSMELIGNMPDGSPTLLRGRVVSTDTTGNCYKQLVIRDETAAVTLTVNISDMYKIYPYGAELLIDVSSLYVGMYNNFMQIGAKEPTRTSPYNVPEDEFKPLVSANGWPQPQDAQPIEVDYETLRTMKQSAEGMEEWQSQLVILNNVEFEYPGSEFSPTYGSTVSQYVRDEKGNRVCLRFSGRSAFAHRIIPGGKGSVTGILSYYGSDWQIIPCTLNDLKGFTELKAPEEINLERATSISNGNYVIWFEGNIVATPYPEGALHGWLQGTSCKTEANGIIRTVETNLFTFTQYEDGWTIADSNGNYLYMEGTFDALQLTDEPDMNSKYTYWTITFEEDGSATISNAGNGKTIRYSTTYNSGGAYSDLSKGIASYLYQPVN